MILKVPQSDIPPDLKLQMGERVMLGNGLEATVREVSKEETVLDCNPPNAGRAVNLEVKLMELTKAPPPPPILPSCSDFCHSRTHQACLR